MPSARASSSRRMSRRSSAGSNSRFPSPPPRLPAWPRIECHRFSRSCSLVSAPLRVPRRRISRLPGSSTHRSRESSSIIFLSTSRRNSAGVEVSKWIRIRSVAAGSGLSSPRASNAQKAAVRMWEWTMKIGLYFGWLAMT